MHTMSCFYTSHSLHVAELSVDWINDKLYWTDRKMRRIEEYNLITGYRRTVVHTVDESLPTGIVVYPYPGYGYVNSRHCNCMSIFNTSKLTGL